VEPQDLTSGQIRSVLTPGGRQSRDLGRVGGWHAGGGV